MADIFISYARVDRERARALATALDLEGWSVWWDRDIPPGRTFDDVIEEALSAAKCVIVLWSRDSVRSEWVKAEASDASRRHLLVPVLADEVTPPLEFRRIQSAALFDWDNLPANPDWSHLCKSLGSLVGRQAASTPSDGSTGAERPAPTSSTGKSGAQGRTRAIVAAGAFVVVAGVAWVVVSRPSAPVPPVVAETPVAPAPEPKPTSEPAKTSTEPVVPAASPEPPVATGAAGPLARSVGRSRPARKQTTAPLPRAPSAANLGRDNVSPVPDAEKPTLNEVAPVALPTRATNLVPSGAPTVPAPPARTTGATAFDVGYTRGVFRESGRLTVSSDGLRYAEASGRSALEAACGDLRRVQTPTMIVDGEQRMVELQLRDRVLRFTLADTAARNRLVSAISEACGAR